MVFRFPRQYSHHQLIVAKMKYYFIEYNVDVFNQQMTRFVFKKQMRNCFKKCCTSIQCSYVKLYSHCLRDKTRPDNYVHYSFYSLDIVVCVQLRELKASGISTMQSIIYDSEIYQIGVRYKTTKSNVVLGSVSTKIVNYIFTHNAQKYH